MEIALPEGFPSLSHWLYNQTDTVLQGLVKQGDPQQVIEYSLALITILNEVKQHSLPKRGLQKPSQSPVTFFGQVLVRRHREMTNAAVSRVPACWELGCGDFQASERVTNSRHTMASKNWGGCKIRQRSQRWQLPECLPGSCLFALVFRSFFLFTANLRSQHWIQKQKSSTNSPTFTLPLSQPPHSSSAGLETPCHCSGDAVGESSSACVHGS